ncbi:MAG: AN1-type zinc finger domain-containing protein [Promethearchaeota archaeon]
MVWPPPYEYKAPQRRTSLTEIIHILIGTILVSLVIGSFFFDPLNLFSDIAMNQSQIFLFVLVSFLAAPAFILHELAHKFVAQKYGYWGEFRLIPFGVILTLISIVSPFKLVGPGAVMIAGTNITREKNGRISLAGPITNFILIGICLLFVPLLPYEIIGLPFLVILAQLNAIIAVFNLLPVSVLDGKKIFNWNRTAWIVSIALSAFFWIILLLFSFSSIIWVLMGVGVLLVAGMIYWNFFRESKGKKIEIIDASEMPYIPRVIRTSSETVSEVKPASKSQSVLVSECEYCGKAVFLPFRCWRCDGFFCYDHRLPENHKCPALDGVG